MRNLIQCEKAQYWDRPWNPMLGCHPISPACKNCYAQASTKRFGCSFDPHRTTRINPPKKGVIFCGNMTDLFGEWIHIDDSIRYILQTTGNPDATYLWLSKRVDKLCSALKYGPFRPHEMTNQYFGFTAENQEWYDRRFKIWKTGKPQWAQGWLSVEPMLGPIDLKLGSYPDENLFRWIVVGCESGARRRSCQIEWVKDLVKQAILAKIPVFVKQLDIDGKCERMIGRFPTDLQIREVPWKKGEI